MLHRLWIIDQKSEVSTHFYKNLQIIWVCVRDECAGIGYYECIEDS